MKILSALKTAASKLQQQRQMQAEPSQTQERTYSMLVQNNSSYALNGTQVVVKLPDGASFAGTTSDTLTVHGSQVVVTLGRLGIGAGQTVEVPAALASGLAGGTELRATTVVRSSTAMPVSSNPTVTIIEQNGQNSQN